MVIDGAENEIQLSHGKDGLTLKVDIAEAHLKATGSVSHLGAV